MASYPILRLAIVEYNTNVYQLRELYEESIAKHNLAVNESRFANAGFDLFVPTTMSIDYPFLPNPQFVSMHVKCEMTDASGNPLAFYLYPRSSISKTPLSLANSVGIIDSGYRGEIIGAFRCNEPFVIEAKTRLLQICSPTLSPFLVQLVTEEELTSTERGNGGFGSTGR